MLNPFDFRGKVALVTGAGAGIGLAAARRLAAAGCQVGLLDRDEQDLARVVGELEAAGLPVLPLPADVGDEAAVRAAFARLEAHWRRLDVVVANAGINGVWAPFDEITLDEWNTTLRVNLTGTYLTIRHALPALRRQGGAIVITASINGTRVFSNPGATAYACSKAGQVTMAKMLAVELGRDGIRVNVICPGAVETQIGQSTEKRDVDDLRPPVIFPAGDSPLTGQDPGQPEQVADLVLYLASAAASHITGTEVYIDGAQSLLRG